VDLVNDDKLAACTIAIEKYMIFTTPSCAARIPDQTSGKKFGSHSEHLCAIYTPLVSIIRLALGESTDLLTICAFTKAPKTGLPEWSSETEAKPYRICRLIYDFAKQMNIYEEISCLTDKFCYKTRLLINILEAYDNSKQCAGLMIPDEPQLPGCTIAADITAMDTNWTNISAPNKITAIKSDLNQDFVDMITEFAQTKRGMEESIRVMEPTLGITTLDARILAEQYDIKRPMHAWDVIEDALEKTELLKLIKASPTKDADLTAGLITKVDDA
jgi:hypothetical protein